MEDAAHAHTTLVTAGGRAATQTKGTRWANLVLADTKRASSGVCHAVRQAEYARRYLAEAAYRFNRRSHLRDLLPRLATALMHSKPRPERALRLARNFHG